MRMFDSQIDTTFWGWIKSALYFVSMALSLGINYIEASERIIFTLTALMVVDWLTGITKAIRLNIKPTSKRSNKGLIEKVMLLVIPISIGVTLKAIDIPIGVTMQTVFSLLLVAELISVISNCYCIYTKTDIQEYDAVTALLKWLKSTIMKAFKGFLSDNNKGLNNDNDNQPSN